MKKHLQKSSTLPEKKESKHLCVTDRADNKLFVPISDADIKTVTGFQIVEGGQILLKMGLAASADQFDHETAQRQADQYLALISELKPQDPFEGLLINQMVLVFRQALDFFTISNLPGNRGNTDIQDSISNRYIKLMRLFNQQLEALDKHRNKGKQTMTVEHVHVHKGGQAIVGNVKQGGGVQQ